MSDSSRDKTSQDKTSRDKGGNDESKSSSDGGKENKAGKEPPKGSEEAARAAREKELRELIQQVEKEHSGSEPPEHESPHDFVERKRREQQNKR
jgi:hypothetical protein